MLGQKSGIDGGKGHQRGKRMSDFDTLYLIPGAEPPETAGPPRNTFSTMGAGNVALEDREKNDFYATPPPAVDGLLRFETFQPRILEPCCGMGHISEALKAYGHDVVSFDLVDRGYGNVRDFFAYNTEKTDFDIITNPPYSNAEDFVNKGLSLLKGKRQKMAMFMRLLFLEGQKRMKLFAKHPPAAVYVASRRIACAKNGDFEKYNTGAVCFAWFVWRHGFAGDPVIKWF